MLEEKRRQLEEMLSGLAKNPICVAFSGGTDSSLLLKAASKAASERETEVYGVTFATRLHPKADLEIARKVAQECGAHFEVLPIDEAGNTAILSNPPDRCYLCKRYLFERLQEWCCQRGIQTILEGTNADDLNVYRPGIRAIQELGILSPLAQLSFTKEEVRELARKMGISVARRPSAPCMATRFPYHTQIDFSLLNRLEQGENYMKAAGFEVVRLRIHGDILRVEVEKEKLPLAIGKAQSIVNELKALGFRYVTLDMEGFRSGSMDEYLQQEATYKI